VGFLGVKIWAESWKKSSTPVSHTEKSFASGRFEQHPELIMDIWGEAARKVNRLKARSPQANFEKPIPFKAFFSQYNRLSLPPQYSILIVSRIERPSL